MTLHIEPVTARLAGELAEFLEQHPQGQWEDDSEVRVEFYFDNEPIGVAVRKDGAGSYSVVVE